MVFVDPLIRGKFDVNVLLDLNLDMCGLHV